MDKTPKNISSKLSKFSRRFNLSGNGLSLSFDENRQGTPSTQASLYERSTIKKQSTDDNQWIKRPTGLGILGHQLVDCLEDPSSLFK